MNVASLFPATAPARRDVGLFVLAAAVRGLALVVAIVAGRFPEFWEQEYMARSILEGRGLTYPYLGGEMYAYLEPLYPVLIAAVYAVTGRSVLALAVVQIVLSALLAPIVARLTHRTFSAQAALAAGLLVALHPALVGYTTKFHPLVLDSFFITLVAATAVRLFQTPGMRNAVGFGCALGGCLLTRPTILVAAVPLLAWAAYRRPRGRVAARWLAALAIAGLIVTPWVVRNYLVLGTFVLGRTSGPWVFWLGNHPGATGGAGDPGDPTGVRSVFDVAPPELRERALATPGEIAKNRIFRDEALRYVREAPLAFVGRTAKKLYYFWWFAPYQGRRYARWQFEVYAAFYVAILAAAVAGLIAARRGWIPVRAEALAIVLAVMLSISLVQAAFYVEGRHRLAIEPLLLVVSGAGIAAATRRMRRSDAREV